MSSLLSDFRRARVHHHVYAEADRLLRSYLTFANDSTIILIIGPSKVGKSTLLADLYSDHGPVGDKIPMILTDAVTLSDRFSMLHLIGRYLRELGHPLYAVDDLESWKSIRKTTRLSETFARPLLETGLKLRNCMYVALDECQQMVTATSANGALHAIESLKCLLHLSPADKHKPRKGEGDALPQRRIGILCGGYKMLDDGLMSAHFGNRLAIIHFRRYQDNDADRLLYASALKGMDTILAKYLDPGKSLLDFEEVLYRGSFGCVGLSYNWTLLAIAAKKASGSKYLLEKHFLSTRFELQMDESLAEIKAGEKRIEALTKAAMEDMHFALENAEDSKTVKARELLPSRERRKNKPRRYSTKGHF